MRLSPLPRALYLGLVYMALHLAAVFLLPDNLGMSGPGPWLPAGLALGILILGGFWVLPFVLFAHVLGCWIQMPASAGVLRGLWPVVVCLFTGAGAWLFHLLDGGRRHGQSYPWPVAAASALASLLCAAFGVLFLKLETPPSSVPCTALLAGFLEPMLLGMLLGTPVILALGRGDFGLRRPHLPGIVEQFSQFAAVFGSAWLADRYGAAAWPFCLVVLVWMALRRGIPGACLAALVLCYGAARNGQVSLADSQGWRALLIFEGAVVLLAVGAAAFFEMKRRELVSLSGRLSDIESFCQSAKVGIWEWRAEGKMDFRGSWERLLPWPKVGAVLDEESWRQAIHPDDLGPLLERRSAILRGEAVHHEWEYRLRCGPGRYQWVQERAEVVERNSYGEPLRMLGMCTGMPGSRSGDSEKAQMLDFIDSAEDVLLVTDLHGNVRHASRTALALKAGAPRIGATRRHISEFFDEAGGGLLMREALPRVRTTGRWSGCVRLMDMEGNFPEAHLSVSLHRDETTLQPEGFVLVARFAEPLRKLLAVPAGTGNVQLERAQRHEGLRALAGGAVHAFNNVLMAVMGNSFLARKDLSPDAPTQRFFANIDQSMQKGMQFCQMLQLCAGRVQAQPAPLDVPKFLPALVEKLGVELNCASRLVVEVSQETPVIHGDAALLEKALHHLFQNACEAYGSAEGSIRIKAGVMNFEPLALASPAPSAVLVRGAHVVIEVHDEGPGLEETLHSRAFDPFFSTKQGHKGLGLAEVAGVVRSHGGSIQLDSAQGKGWHLRMIFPLKDAKSYASSASAAGPVSPREESAGRSAATAWRTSGDALVIDDESAVREVTSSMLVTMGLTPVSASSGGEALRLLRDKKTNLRVILLDYAMPEMDGVQTCMEIRRLGITLPVIFVTGHGDREIRERLPNEENLRIITKPFSMERLQGVLRERLSA